MEATKRRPGRPAGPTVYGQPVRCVLVHAGHGGTPGPHIERFVSTDSALACAVAWARHRVAPESLSAWRRAPTGWVQL